MDTSKLVAFFKNNSKWIAAGAAAIAVAAVAYWSIGEEDTAQECVPVDEETVEVIDVTKEPKEPKKS